MGEIHLFMQVDWKLFIGDWNLIQPIESAVKYFSSGGIYSISAVSGCGKENYFVIVAELSHPSQPFLIPSQLHPKRDSATCNDKLLLYFILHLRQERHKVTFVSITLGFTQDCTITTWHGSPLTALYNLVLHLVKCATCIYKFWASLPESEGCHVCFHFTVHILWTSCGS